MAKRYIDLDDALELLKQHRERMLDGEKTKIDELYEMACLHCEDVVRCCVPTADVVERKRGGEWIYKQIALKHYSVTCPFCGLEYTDNYDGYVDVGCFNFCPNCGADLRGVMLHEEI